MDFIRHIITGIDNHTVDVARVLWIFGIFSFLGFAGYEVFKSQHFDMLNFATAYGVMLAAGAAGVKIKETCEPQRKPSE